MAFPVGIDFLFPDGKLFLDGVDEEAAKVEGGGTVRGGDADPDGGFTGDKDAYAMGGGNGGGAMAADAFGGNGFEHRGDERFSGLVMEMTDGAVVVTISHHTFEDDDSSELSGVEVAAQGQRVDGFFGEIKHERFGSRAGIVRAIFADARDLTQGRGKGSLPMRRCNDSYTAFRFVG